MDFKVAGTKDGITSLQMDIKITGITFEIMEQALSQAKDGRVHILGEMNKALSASRADVGNSALYLLSDLANGATGEIHYVDAGYNKVGMPDPKNIT